jgi:oligosaccharide repeat unit polymerase
MRIIPAPVRLATLVMIASIVAGLAIPRYAGHFDGFSVAYACLFLGFCILARTSGRVPIEGVFLAPWYALAFAARASLTTYQTTWSVRTSLAVLVGPIFLWLGYKAFTRGTSDPAPHAKLEINAIVSASRAIVVSIILGMVGIAGLIAKARILGTLPALSPHIDDLRSAGRHIPALVTFATNCSSLAFWVASTALLEAKLSAAERSILTAIAATSLISTAAHGSRNTVAFTIVVLIFFMALRGRIRLTGRAAVLTAITIVACTTVVFIFRTSQDTENTFGRYFYSQGVAQTTLGRAAMGEYISVTYPFETFNREVAYFSDPSRRGHGRYTGYGYSALTGGLVHGRDLVDVSRELSKPFFFNVGTYLGTLFADFGVAGVLVGSALFGSTLGALRRVWRRRPSLLATWTLAYALYIVAFFSYENLLAFYPNEPWNIGILSFALIAIRGRRVGTYSATLPPRDTSFQDAQSPPRRRAPAARLDDNTLSGGGAMIVSAIVVSYGAPPRLVRLLRSFQLLEVPRGVTLEIIVVENAQDDECCALAAACREVTMVVEPAFNGGFAGGANAGWRFAMGDWILLLNDDTILDPHVLRHLCPRGGWPSSVGIVAPTLVFASAPWVINSAGLEVDALGVARDRLLGCALAQAGCAATEVFGACGGAALYRAELIDDVGGFDESFFAYLEDVDLAWRARAAGWRCLSVPRAIVLHDQSASFGNDSSHKLYLVGRNRIWLVAKNASRGHLARWLVPMVVYDCVYSAYLSVAARTTAPWRGRWAGLRALPARPRDLAEHSPRLERPFGVRSALRRRRRRKALSVANLRQRRGP